MDGGGRIIAAKSHVNGGGPNSTVSGQCELEGRVQHQLAGDGEGHRVALRGRRPPSVRPQLAYPRAWLAPSSLSSSAAFNT